MDTTRRGFLKLGAAAPVAALVVTSTPDSAQAAEVTPRAPAPEPEEGQIFGIDADLLKGMALGAMAYWAGKQGRELAKRQEAETA